MSDRTLAQAGDSFQVGSVLNRTFSLLLQNIVKLTLLQTIIFVPLVVLIIVAMVPIFATIGMAAAHKGPGQLPLPFGTMMILFPVFFIAIIGVSVMSQGAGIYGIFRRMSGKPFRIFEAIGSVFPRLLPAFGMFLLMMIAVYLGLILLVVPGMILALMFSVAMPVCIVEKRGPIDSLQRSADLTRGHRWQILGIFLVFMLVAVAISLLLFVVDYGLASVHAGVVGTIIGGVIRFVVQMLLSAFPTVLIAVIYYDLRVAKEGIDIDRIAAVFD